MRLDVDEFVRRFLLHVTPTGFVQVRHYGLLANRNRTQKISLGVHRIATLVRGAEEGRSAIESMIARTDVGMTGERQPTSVVGL